MSSKPKFVGVAKPKYAVPNGGTTRSAKSARAAWDSFGADAEKCFGHAAEYVGHGVTSGPEGENLGEWVQFKMAPGCAHLPADQHFVMPLCAVEEMIEAFDDRWGHARTVALRDIRQRVDAALGDEEGR